MLAQATQTPFHFGGSLRKLRNGESINNGACASCANENLFSGEVAQLAQGQNKKKSCLRKLRKHES